MPKRSFMMSGTDTEACMVISNSESLTIDLGSIVYLNDILVVSDPQISFGDYYYTVTI